MKKLLSQKQVNKKYAGKYVHFISSFNWTTRQEEYEIIKVYKEIHENTTLGEDVGTRYEYTR